MFHSPDYAHWRARTDGTSPEHLRWHQVIHLAHAGPTGLPALAERQKGVAFIGFASDEGVARNEGRIGAAEAPDIIRRFCASLPFHAERERLLLADCGTITCPDQNLEAAQAELAEAITAIIKAGYFPIVWGGGHEVTLGHWRGSQASLPQGESLAILNLDAHWDLRDRGQQPHSGNSFRYIAQDCEAAGLSFHYVALGIQKISNTVALFNTAAGLEASYVESQDGPAMLQAAERFAAEKAHLALTVDMDVFPASVAPGVSAPNPLGIGVHEARVIIAILCQSGKLHSVDLAEFNPRHDVDNRTARLCAALTFEVVMGILQASV